MTLLRFLRSVAAPWWSSNSTCTTCCTCLLNSSHAAGLALAGIRGGSFMTIERALIVSMTQKQTNGK